MLALLSSNVYPGASIDMRIAVYPERESYKMNFPIIGIWQTPIFVKWS